MLHYVARRILLMIPTLFIISALVYVIIDLPPGDCVTSQIDELLARGDPDALHRADELRALYGLDHSLVYRYFHWVAGIFRWDFGLSCQDTVPVADLIGERIVLTMVMETATIAFIWIVSFVIGVYAATHQYQVGDYVASTRGRLEVARLPAYAPELNPAEYEWLVIPGGACSEKLRLREEVLDIARTQIEDGRKVASIGRGVQVLLSAGAIDAKRIACPHAIRDDIRASGGIWVDVPSVVEGNLHSCRSWQDLPHWFQTLFGNQPVSQSLENS